MINSPAVGANRYLIDIVSLHAPASFGLAQSRGNNVALGRDAGDLLILNTDDSSVYSSYGKYVFFTVDPALKGARSASLWSVQSKLLSVV